ETLVAAQPAMGSVLTVVDLALSEVARAQTVRAGARAVQRAMERYVRRQVTAVERAARRLPGVLPGRAVVLTLSSSEVVYRAARATRRPLLVVTSTDRLLGGSLAGRLRLPGTEPRHISTGRRKPVHALDRLFEATPLRLVAAVLTDAGTMAPETVRRRLRARK